MTEPFNPPVKIEVRLAVFSLCWQQLQTLLLPAKETLSGGEWELPAATLPADRSIEETAQACLSRLVRPSEVFLEKLYTYGEIDRHPYRRVISVAYFAFKPRKQYFPRYLVLISDETQLQYKAAEGILSIVHNPFNRRDVLLFFFRSAEPCNKSSVGSDFLRRSVRTEPRVTERISVRSIGRVFAPMALLMRVTFADNQLL